MAIRLDNRPDQESDNKIQQDYDDKFNELTSPQHMSKDGEEPSLYNRESKPDQDTSAPLSDAQQAKADNKEGEEGGSLYEQGSDTNKPVKEKIKGAFAGKKKYGWIGGGVAGTVIALIVTLFPVLGPTHIFKNLDRFDFEPNNHFSNRRANRVVDKLKSNFSPAELKSPLNKRLSAVAPADLKADLATRGYNLELDNNGKPVRITDPNGKSIAINDPAAFEVLDDVLPLAQSAKRGFFRRYISGAFNYSWVGILKNTRADGSIWKTIYDKSVKGTAYDPVRAQVAPVDENGNPISNPDAADASKGNTVIEEGAQIAAEKKAEGASDAESLKAGSDHVKNSGLNPKSLAFGIFVTTCILQEAYDSQLQTKYYNARSAIEQVFDLAIITNEFENHDTRNLDHIGDYFSKYNNGGKTFASAAGWQEMTGQPVVGPSLSSMNSITTATSEDILGDALGAAGVAGSVISEIWGLSNICGFFNLVVGTVIGAIIVNALDWTFAAADIFLACVPGGVATVGASCALRIGAAAFFEGFMPFIISAVLNAGAQKVIDNPVEAMNFLSHGAAFANSEMSRTGARVTNETYDEDVAYYMEYRKSQNNSLYDRYASIENPNSLAFALASQKTQISGSIKSVGDAVTSIAFSPSFLLNRTVSSMFGGSNSVYAQSVESPRKDIPKFTKNNMLDSDPDEIVQQAMSLLENSEDARITALNCMGYDYETDTLDPNLQLPMYSNPGPDEDGFFASLGSALFGTSNAKTKNDIVETYCIDGNADEVIDTENTEVQIGSANYALLGRFVDDLMLAEQIFEITEGIE